MSVITKFLTNSNGKMLVDSATGKPLSITIDVVDGLSIRLAEREAVSTTYSTFASYSTTSQTYSNITNASEFAVGDVAILQWTITDRDNTVGIIFAEVSAVSSNSITAKGLGMAVKGDSGEDGAQVEVRVADGQLQWKYDNQDSWTALAELSDLSALTYSTVWSAPSVPFEGLEIGLHTMYFNRSPQADEFVTVVMGGSPNFDDTKGRSWIAVCKITGQVPENESVTAAIITKIVETTGNIGNPGKDGDDGKAATIQIGTVTTSAAGTQAAVTNTGTANAAVLDFVIPRGEPGTDGVSPHIGSDGYWYVGDTNTNVKAEGQDGEDGVGIPAGGTVGQVLRKASAEDYACEWAEPAGVDIVDIGTVADLVFGNEGTGAVNISDELYNRLMVVGGVIMKFTTSDNQEIYLNGMVRGNGIVYAGTFGGGGTVIAYYGEPQGSSQKQVAIVATAIKYEEFATTSGTYPNMTVGKATNATNIIPNANGVVNPLGRKDGGVVGNLSTALGKDSTASGEASTALGREASASGGISTAIGSVATASGTRSIALGYSSKASGGYSMAFGDAAIARNDYSIALGYNSKTEGDSSIAIGNGAATAYNASIAIGNGASAVSDSGTAIGNGADASGLISTALGVGAYALSTGSTALGRSARVPSTNSNTMQLGNDSLSALRCKVNLTVTSDKRDKTDIEDITDALAFIERLNPVTFVSNDREEYISDEDKNGETFRTYGMCEYDRASHAAGTKKGERRRCGLLAQEVVEAMQSVYGTDNYANVVNDNFHDLTEKPSDVENKYTLAYANLVPFLIGAIKELNAKIKTLNGAKEL